MENQTALVSAFARAYHFRNNSEWIFKDDQVMNILTETEYQTISENMANGISFFCPGFEGTRDEALAFIVDNQLAPSVLIRSRFCEDSLKVAVMLGCEQYALLASGYDSFCLRNKNPDLDVFELDLRSVIEDKIKRIENSGCLSKIRNTHFIPCDLSTDNISQLLEDHGFIKDLPSFGSLLGISYYLSKTEFESLIKRVGEIWCEGSSICFDYQTLVESSEASKNEQLASGAGEAMKAKYTYKEMEALLSRCGFLIYELKEDERTPSVNYILAVHK